MHDGHPRYRWLKRLAGAGLLLVIAVAGLRLYWGQAMQSRLDERVAAIQSKGEPVRFEDLTFQPIADQDNGAWHLLQARAAWPTINGYHVDDEHWYAPWPDDTYHDPVTDNKAYLARCQPALDALRQAALCSDADWGVQLSRPIFDVNLPSISEPRRLARLMEDAARRAIVVGDIELALEINLLMHAVARHVQARPICALESLIASSILAIHTEFIHHELPTMDPALLSDGRARELAERLIAELTDDTMMREGLIRGFIAERVACYDYIQCVLDQVLNANNSFWMNDTDTFIYTTPGLRQMMRPMLKHAQVALLEDHTRRIEALRNKQTYPAHAAQEEAFIRQLSRDKLLYPLLDQIYGVYDATLRTAHRTRANRLMAATALAIKLYEADHGERPGTLQRLVPDYLAAVPADPFAGDGRAIGYVPAGVAPTLDEPYRLTAEQRGRLALRPYALLYSVDRDGTDQGGKPLVMWPEGDLNDDRYASHDEQGDIWFLLDPWPERVFEESELNPVYDEFGAFDEFEDLGEYDEYEDEAFD